MVKKKKKKSNNPPSVKREELHLELMLVMRLISSPANASKNKGEIMRLFSLVFNSIKISLLFFRVCFSAVTFSLSLHLTRSNQGVLHMFVFSFSLSFFWISTWVNDLEWLTILWFGFMSVLSLQQGWQKEALMGAQLLLCSFPPHTN